MEDITSIVPPGVVTGDNLLKLFEHARDNNYAIPGTRAMMRFLGLICSSLVFFF